MSRQLNPAQMWSQQPLASRTASVIKSIQLGTVGISDASVSNTGTISAVTTAKSAISWLGLSSAATLDISKLVRVTLTNTTTVTVTRGANQGDVTVGYQVVEYY